MKPWAKYSIAALTVIVVILAGVLVWAAADGGTTKVARAGAQAEAVQARAESNRWLEAKIRRRQKKNAEAAAAERRARAKAEVEKTGIDGSPGQRPVQANSQGGKGEASSASFAKVESEIDGEVGVAYAPLGSAEPVELGSLQIGHAWSSFKVPIVVTVMLEQGGTLTSGQESLAASAITASDNTAAAALFSELESRTGGEASAAVERTLGKVLGGATEVATAPPPPGAVSSWGQTEWPLSASTSFYGALACGAFGGATETVLRDMESVIPEQQWASGRHRSRLAPKSPSRLVGVRTAAKAAPIWSGKPGSSGHLTAADLSPRLPRRTPVAPLKQAYPTSTGSPTGWPRTFHPADPAESTHTNVQITP